MKELRIIAEWILKNYPNADKIVEIGAGETTIALEELTKELSDCELIATDIHKIEVPEGVKFVEDDITKPEHNIYEDADLIFSIRLPPELYPDLFEISQEVSADLLVKPVSSEEAPKSGKLVNYSGTSFYILKNRKN